MVELSSDRPLSALRLRVTGTWSAGDFHSLLSTLDDLYMRLATVELLGDFLKQEQDQNKRLHEQKKFDEEDYSWSNLFYGYNYPRDATLRQPPFQDVVTAVRPFVFELVVDAIRLESPGFLQLLGKINPLRIIANFISKYRAENTKRLKLEVDRERIEVDRERIEADRERNRIQGNVAVAQMRSQLALELFRQLPPSERIRQAERALPELISYGVQHPTDALHTIAADARVLEAQLVPPGTPLPIETAPNP